jgi:hypothetical protein
MNELRWITPAKTAEVSRISVHKIESILFGFKTYRFKKHMEEFKGKEEMACTIKYLGKADVLTKLNVVFNSVNEMQLFITGLQYVTLKEKFHLVLATQYAF